MKRVKQWKGKAWVNQAGKIIYPECPAGVSPVPRWACEREVRVTITPIRPRRKGAR